MNIKRKKQTLMARAVLLMLLVLWVPPSAGYCRKSAFYGFRQPPTSAWPASSIAISSD